MYHKEQIINGILCYKTSPEGKWIEMSTKELTDRITAQKKEISELLVSSDQAAIEEYRQWLHNQVAGTKYLSPNHKCYLIAYDEFCSKFSPQQVQEPTSEEITQRIKKGINDWKGGKSNDKIVVSVEGMKLPSIADDTDKLYPR